MNRILSLLLLIVVMVVGYFMYKHQDVGYLKLGFAEYKFETSLLVVGATTMVFLVALVLVARALGLAIRSGKRLIAVRKLRQLEALRHSLVQGLIELSEGRFSKAEKILLQKIDQSENKLVTYLLAARAAQLQGAHDRRDEYLRLAHQSTPTADIAIGLTQAELQLAHKQYEQSLATLKRVNEISPKHTFVLKLLAKAYFQLHDWNKLIDLIPDLKKQNVFPQHAMLDFEIKTWSGLMAEHAEQKNLPALDQGWANMPRSLKALPSIVESYARTLIKIGASVKAETVLRKYLSNNWVESTIELYSELDVLTDNDKQVETAERWLTEHQHNAYLLLALGKMHIGRSLWGKARSYLEASLSAKPLPETYLKLAQLLEEHMAEHDQAQDYYRQGLYLVAGGYCNGVLPAPESKPEVEVEEVEPKAQETAD